VPAVMLDDTDSVDGRYSLRAPFSRLGFTARPQRYDGIALRSAVPASLTPGTSYSFSVYIKSDKPKHGRLILTPNSVAGYRSTPLATRDILIGTEWKRVGLTYTPKENLNVFWEIQVDSRTAGHVWLDALQLEPGAYSDYEPAADLEATLSSDRPGMIFSSRERPSVVLRAHNYSGASFDAQTFKLEVFEIGSKLVHEETVYGALAPGGGFWKKVTLPIDKNGIYRCVLHLGDSPNVESQLNFSVLPPARQMPASESAFGAYLTVAPEPLEIMQRVGFRWIANLTSNGQMVYWKQVEPREGDYIWYDDDVMLARSYGFEFMFNLEPCMTPMWATSFSKKKMIGKWSEYVQEMVKHYGHWVKYWTIGDEVHHGSEKNSWMSPCWTSASEYAAWHQAGYRAIKKVDPDAKVIFNTLDDFASKTFEYLPPRQVDILAANAYHSPILLKRMKQVAVRHGITTLWAPGIAVDNLPFYRELLPIESRGVAVGDYWRNKNRELVKSVIQTFALGFERLFHYTATYVGNTNYPSLFEADSGLKPIGAQFGALIWLLDGFESSREVVLDRLEQSIRLFRFDRRDHMTVFAFWALASDRQVARFTKVSGTDIVLYDNFANVLPFGFADHKSEMVFGKEPVFLIVPSRNAESVERALRSMTLRIDDLPEGSEHVVVGRYAKIVGVTDEISRQKPNVSLWYLTNTNGWIEILRFRASDFLPDYKVTKNGFEIEWNLLRPTGAFYLEPGMLPGDLVHGAVIHSSRQDGEIYSWTRRRVDASVNSNSIVHTSPVSSPGGAGLTGPLVHVFNLASGPQIRFETVLEGDRQLFGGQDRLFGGWQVITRPSGECFLHQYYKPGQTGRMKIRVRVSVEEHGSNAVH
jgi:hypothetical protein